jgi:ABC-type Fe3+-hydroxamate transport system substrate-binding protein
MQTFKKSIGLLLTLFLVLSMLSACNNNTDVTDGSTEPGTATQQPDTSAATTEDASADTTDTSADTTDISSGTKDVTDMTGRTVTAPAELITWQCLPGPSIRS